MTGDEEEKVIDFPIEITDETRLHSRATLYMRVHTHTRTTKAFYFTGIVAISVNTIKPSVHVPRLRRSRGVWKYVQEAYTLFSS